MEKLEEAINKLPRHAESVKRVKKEFVAFKKAEVLKIAKIKRMKEGEHGFDFTPSYLTLHKTVDAVLQILDKPPMEACVIVPRKKLEERIEAINKNVVGGMQGDAYYEGMRNILRELLGVEKTK